VASTYWWTLACSSDAQQSQQVSQLHHKESGGSCAVRVQFTEEYYTAAWRYDMAL